MLEQKNRILPRQDPRKGDVGTEKQLKISLRSAPLVEVALALEELSFLKKPVAGKNR